MDTTSEDEALKAASMYYLQDMKMEAIARQMRTSRSTVSRLISAARSNGLVEISVKPSRTFAPSLASRITQTFGVNAHVVPVPDSASEGERLDQVATATGKLVSQWFDSGMVLGVAWGTTVAAISRRLAHKSTRGSEVVQLNGAANPHPTGLEYASSLMIAVGSAFNATIHHFPVPAFFDSAETKAAMWRERSVRRILEVQARADIALFGVGAIAGTVASHVYSSGYFDADDERMLAADGVVGDICTVLLRADGTWDDITLNERATGPTPRQLLGTPMRVCAAAGDGKVRPLLGALRAGTVTDLIIDELTAGALWRTANAGELSRGGLDLSGAR
jgi:deoxyribonucleoside regulator